MMRRSGQIPWRVSVAVGGLLLTAIVLAIVSSIHLDAWQFALARQRWDARPFSRYQLVLEHSFTATERGQTVLRCQQTIEVEAERIRRIVSSTCAPHLTVTTIFARFEPHVTNPVTLRRCGPGGCTCYASQVIADYDSDLGYPEHIRLVWRNVTPGVGQRWQQLLTHLPGMWRRQAQALVQIRNPCDATSLSHPSFFQSVHNEDLRILSLTPLP
jgi:hypothetical protein